MISPSLATTVGAVGLCLLANACGGSTQPDPKGSIGLSLSASSATITQGEAAASITATVTRSGGFTGPVTVSVTGQPTGVSANQNSQSQSGTTTTVVISVSASATAAVGSFTLSVRASGSGVVDASSSATITVAAAPVTGGFTLTASAATLSVQAGATGTSSLTVARTGAFAGGITFTTAEAPAGVTASYAPNPATTTPVTVTVSVGSAVPAGAYQLKITGSAGAITQTVTVSLAVTAPPTGAGNVALRLCADSIIPTADTVQWVAYQDGSGPWTNLARQKNGLYSFDINSGKGGVAFVTGRSVLATAQYQLLIFYGTKDELKVLGEDFCPLGARSVEVPLSGLPIQANPPIVLLTGFLGGINNSGNYLIGAPMRFISIPDGPRDLVVGAVSNPVLASTNDAKIGLRRNLNPAATGVLPTFDFSTELITPAFATITLAGAAANETVRGTASFTTANGLAGTYADLSATALGSFPFFGVPDARLQPGDLHTLSLTAETSGATRNARTVTKFVANVANQSLALGPAANTPTISTIAGSSYPRFRAQWTVQPEYNRVFNAAFGQATGAVRTAQVFATASYLGGATTVDLSIPDFSALANWRNTYALTPGVTTFWLVNSTGGSFDAGLVGKRTSPGGMTVSAGIGPVVIP